MTGESFFEYISNVFIKYLDDSNIPRPVVLFLDGHKSHLTFHLSKLCQENKIHLVALYPNSMHILQPLDVALFSPLKKRWKKLTHQWRLDHEFKEITKADVPSALKNLDF